jgi:hypothetical protein
MTTIKVLLGLMIHYTLLKVNNLATIPYTKWCKKQLVTQPKP